MGKFVPNGLVRYNRNLFLEHFEAGLWIALQVVVPVGMFIPCPIRGDDEEVLSIAKVSNRDGARQTGLAPRSMQDQHILSGDSAAKPPVADTDQKGVDNHQPFD